MTWAHNRLPMDYFFSCPTMLYMFYSHLKHILIICNCYRWFPLKRRYIETRYWWLRLFDENLHIALHSIEQSELSACVGTSDVDIVFERIVSNIWPITSNIVDVGEFDHSEERQTIINNTNLSARNIYISRRTKMLASSTHRWELPPGLLQERPVTAEQRNTQVAQGGATISSPHGRVFRT